jgi:hypothetical protein
MPKMKTTTLDETPERSVKKMPTTEKPLIVFISDNDILYHSKNIHTDEKTARYPVFFALNVKIAQVYTDINPHNRCIRYKNNKRRTLIVLGEPSDEIDKLMRFLNPRQPAFCPIAINILKSFFGYAQTIDEVLTAIRSLQVNINKIEKIITDIFNPHPTKYARFSRDVKKLMSATLETYSEKLNKYLVENEDVDIIPSRTTDRNFDMFLCNILKYMLEKYKIEIDGFYCNELNLHSISSRDPTKITQNEVITSYGMVVPSEICLFEGYNFLENIGECIPHGKPSSSRGGKKSKSRKSKSRKSKSRKSKSRKYFDIKRKY